jgi:hypothetical protein
MRLINCASQLPVRGEWCSCHDTSAWRSVRARLPTDVAKQLAQSLAPGQHHPTSIRISMSNSTAPTQRLTDSKTVHIWGISSALAAQISRRTRTDSKRRGEGEDTADDDEPQVLAAAAHRAAPSVSLGVFLRSVSARPSAHPAMQRHARVSVVDQSRHASPATAGTRWAPTEHASRESLHTGVHAVPCTSARFLSSQQGVFHGDWAADGHSIR